MSARHTTANVKQQDELAGDGLTIPNFLKISAADRRRAWITRPPQPVAAAGRELTETERAYRASIERDRAVKRAADEVRFKAMRAKAAAEKAEREAVEQAVQQRKREERRARRAT